MLWLLIPKQKNVYYYTLVICLLRDIEWHSNYITHPLFVVLPIIVKAVINKQNNGLSTKSSVHLTTQINKF